MPWRKIVFVAVTILNLVLLAGLVTGENGLFSYLDLRDRHQALNRQIEEADRMSRELSRDIRLMTSDPGYQEMVVRDELNYLRQGEILYLFPEGETAKGEGDAK
jgi:cell division protein FtsB